MPAEKGCASIPQAAHTLGYYWVEYRKDETGLSNADGFVNECGVVITSNSMGTSRESADNAACVKDGGIAYNLRRALAERARTARDGARILMELVDEWGYAPSGRAYTIADQSEAFMFQLARGRHYMGARVPDDAIAVMPNHFNLHGLNDYPEQFYPADLVTYAVSRGWYKPAKDGDFSRLRFCQSLSGGGRVLRSAQRHAPEKRSAHRAGSPVERRKGGHALLHQSEPPRDPADDGRDSQLALRGHARLLRATSAPASPRTTLPPSAISAQARRWKATCSSSAMIRS